MIQQKLTPSGIETNVQSQNQGIADSEVILIVEAWLKKIKESFQNNITDGMIFGGKPPEK